MANQFTEVATQGFFSRLFGSIIGVFLGPVFVIAAIILLSWNEGRAVHAITRSGTAVWGVFTHLRAHRCCDSLIDGVREPPSVARYLTGSIHY